MPTAKNSYSIRAKVFKWQGQAAWHFIGVPKKESEEIKKHFGSASKGWGSLPVIVTLGETSWNTSIFPDRKLGVYLLPLKSAVRKKECISEGSIVKIAILLG